MAMLFYSLDWCNYRDSSIFTLRIKPRNEDVLEEMKTRHNLLIMYTIHFIISLWSIERYYPFRKTNDIRVYEHGQ